VGAVPAPLNSIVRRQIHPGALGSRFICAARLQDPAPPADECASTKVCRTGALPALNHCATTSLLRHRPALGPDARLTQPRNQRA
jgi:hypothetical protein